MQLLTRLNFICDECGMTLDSDVDLTTATDQTKLHIRPCRCCIDSLSEELTTTLDATAIIEWTPSIERAIPVDGHDGAVHLDGEGMSPEQAVSLAYRLIVAAQSQRPSIWPSTGITLLRLAELGDLLVAAERTKHETTTKTG